MPVSGRPCPCLVFTLITHASMQTEESIQNNVGLKSMKARITGAVGNRTMGRASEIKDPDSMINE